MGALLDPASYTFRLQSLPFLVTGLIVAGMAVYVLFMRGAWPLRVSFLAICAGAVGPTLGFALAGSSTSPTAAEAIYRLGIAPTPLATAGVLAFELTVLHQLVRYRTLLLVAVLSALLQVVVLLTSDLYISGVWTTSLGMYHYRGGAFIWVFLVGTAGWLLFTLGLGWYHLRSEPEGRRRRQIKGSLLAFAAMTLAVVDIPLGFGVGMYPLSWLFLCVGSILALRSLILDDLIEGQVFDVRAPVALLYLVAATIGVWAIWYVAGDLPVVVLVPLVLLLYLSLRGIIAVLGIVRRPSMSLANTLLDRLIEQYATRVQKLHEVPDIGALTSETIALGLGCQRVDMLVPARHDYSWRTLAGETLSEAATPDPLILSWFLDNPGPVVGEELQARRLGDSRESVERLFAANQAEVMMPLVSRDHMVGMLVIAGFERSAQLSPEERRFLERIQEYASVALDYAHMHREASARVELYKQMELAAAVQAGFVPSGTVIDYGSVVVRGMWAPASQCGGDWWWTHELPDGRVLVLIGDVTGHGVAAAMVTAAAKGCYDVAQRLMGSDLDLVRLLGLLDASVHRVGGERFHMTCFAALLDPAAGQVTYANAGHLVPYLCRRRQGGGVDLGVLAARGTPLGVSSEPRYRAHTRELREGDLLVWYTDGIVECVNRDGRAFGDRRLQRLLRKLTGEDQDVGHVVDQIVRAVLAFQGGLRADDDITLVVTRVRAGRIPGDTTDETPRASPPTSEPPSGEAATSRAHPSPHV
ncbi:PP2C family protein-serine/threonine phosphatase [Haliangium sp.]|uniref:PP2C family protein-serine/threonine phosphatase n=1 Tax=Haliangium sp. TaxID=2663208 RepID=UPI003D0F1D9F